MEKDFLDVVIKATGLPEDLIRKEIFRLTSERGLDANQITIDDLRSIMVSYLQAEILKAKSHY